MSKYISDDEYIISELSETKEKGQPSLHDSKQGGTYKTHNFLNRELQRVESIEKFFNIKLSNAIVHPQTEILIDKYSTDLELKEYKLIQTLSHPDSFLWKKIDDFWNNLFS